MSHRGRDFDLLGSFQSFASGLPTLENVHNAKMEGLKLCL